MGPSRMSAKGSSPGKHPQGFRTPNYTQVPNDPMDYWLPKLLGAELKVLLYLARRTFGFHRDRVQIGIRRICNGNPGKDHGTGLDTETAANAINSLESKGLLTAQRIPGGRTTYSLRFQSDVYGKSGHPCAENPDTSVYGKSEQEERKSSSERKLKKETKPQRSKSRPGQPARTRQETTPAKTIISARLDDDEKKLSVNEPIVHPLPEVEIRAIFKDKTGLEMNPKVFNLISDLCELRGVSRAQYVEKLRPHVPNKWKNPAGFMTYFAQNIRSEMGPSQSLRELLVVKETLRCEKCHGTGRQDDVQYCVCQLGKDLERLHRKKAAETSALPRQDSSVPASGDLR
jgi:hypothetical protein